MYAALLGVTEVVVAAFVATEVVVPSPNLYITQVRT